MPVKFFSKVKEPEISVILIFVVFVFWILVVIGEKIFKNKKVGKGRHKKIMQNEQHKRPKIDEQSLSATQRGQQLETAFNEYITRQRQIKRVEIQAPR